MSTDSGLEGTPYFGLQRKILQDIARKKNKLNDNNNSSNNRTDVKGSNKSSKKISRKNFDLHSKDNELHLNNTDSIKNQEDDTNIENASSGVKSSTASKKRKLSDISPQKVSNSGNSETKLAETRKKLALNDSQKIKDRVPTRSSESTSSSSNSSSSDSKYSNDRTIYIQGLPFSATEDDVRKLFEPCGKIDSIRLPKWHDSGRIKGYGHIEYQDSSSAT